MILVFLIGAAAAATLVRQYSADKDTLSLPLVPPESTSAEESVPTPKEEVSLEPASEPSITPPSLAKTFSANQSNPPQKTSLQISKPQVARSEPLPDSPFLLPGSATPEAPLPVLARSDRPADAEASFSSLSWLQISAGTTTLSQQQEDRTYSETRTLTNPLTLLISLGASLSESLGAEFSWGQKIVSGSTKNNNIPNSSFAAGLTWQPQALKSANYFLRWGLGLNLDEATYINGAPSESRLTNYSRTGLYGSAQYNTVLTAPWYLDIKLILTLSPLKPESFSEYTENGWLLRITPQYEFSKNLRVGLSLEYKNRDRQLGIVNHLGQADSSDIKLREFQTAITLQYSF
ncbi:MAG: hypothetical protein HUU57_13835 [Bdellovibrio sp.]|nr:hypothetical protein [Bdellovibrio sp.]